MYHVPGRDGRYAYFPRSYGFPKLLVQLNITYTDGSTVSVVSDETWQRADSPVTYSVSYGGEEYDARNNENGFFDARLYGLKFGRGQGGRVREGVGKGKLVFSARRDAGEQRCRFMNRNR